MDRQEMLLLQSKLATKMEQGARKLNPPFKEEIDLSTAANEMIDMEMQSSLETLNNSGLTTIEMVAIGVKNQLNHVVNGK